MKRSNHSLLIGHVEHRRIAKVGHKLNYRVFSVLVNLDKLAELDRGLRLFSVNRRNLLSLNTTDLADGKQSCLSTFAKELVRSHLPDTLVHEVWLQTYPRVLGFVFNPLSVYFCLDASGQVVANIYEVSNTFGGRVHYVQAVKNGKIEPASKTMLVSPFNGTRGRYSFSMRFVEDQLAIGVALREKGKPVLKTWYRARQARLTDRGLLKEFFLVPLLAFKVVGAIHFEALKLWLKGLRPPAREKGLRLSAKETRMNTSVPKHSN